MAPEVIEQVYDLAELTNVTATDVYFGMAVDYTAPGALSPQSVREHYAGQGVTLVSAAIFGGVLEYEVRPS